MSMRVARAPEGQTLVIECTEKGAKQSMKAECDINNILKRYAKTGLLTPVNKRPPMFIDVSDVGDYRTAIENVRAAETEFMRLPAAIRARFGNDPAVFLDFAVDPANEQEMRDMGLLPALEEPEKEPKAKKAAAKEEEKQVAIEDPPVGD